MTDSLRVIVDADASPLVRELGRAGAEVRGFGTAVSSQSRGALAFSAAVNKQRQSLHGLTSMARTASLGIGVGLVVALGSAIKTGAEFQSEMARVQAVTGATGKEMDQLRKLAIKLGADTKFSAGQAAEAMYELSSAGFNVQETSKALPGVLALAAASGIELAAAAEISSNALRGFGLQTSESTHVADVLAKSVNSSSVEMTDLQLSLKYIGPVAQATGESFEQMIAAVSLMGNAGIKGEQAGTTLRTGLLRLVKPTKQVEEGMGALGLSAEDLQGPHGLLPLPALVGKLQAGMAGLTQAQKAAALSQIFGNEAMSGMFMLVKAGPDQLAALTKGFENSAGASAKAAKIMNTTVKGSFEELKGSFETVEIELFEHFSKPLRHALLGATSFVNVQGEHLQEALDKAMATPEFKSADVGKKAELMADAFGAVWKSSGLQGDITEGLTTAFNYALPKVAVGAGHLGIAVAEGVAQGFFKSDALGRLVIGGWLFSKFGGFAALKAAGLRAGTTAGTGMATGIEEGAVTGVASGSFASRFKAKLGGLTGIAKGVGVMLAINGLIGGMQAGLENTNRQVNLGGFLHDFSIGTFRSFGINLGETTGEEFTKAFQGKVHELTSGSVQIGKQVSTGAIDQREEQAKETTLTHFPDMVASGVNPEGTLRYQRIFDKEFAGLMSDVKAAYPTTKQLFAGLWDQMEPEERQLANQVRNSLIAAQKFAARFHLRVPPVTVETSPQTFKQLERDFSLLRSGSLSSMHDISAVTSKASKLIARELGANTKAGREAMAANFRAAALAVGKAMADGEIFIKTGLTKQQQLFRNAQLVSGEDPFGIAKGFTSSWKKAGEINAQQRQNAIKDLAKMPPEARQKAFDTMVEFGKGLVQKSVIPQQDLRNFVSKALSHFDELKAGSGKKSGETALTVAGNLGAMAFAVLTGLGTVAGETNKALQAFNAKPVKVQINQGAKIIGNIAGKLAGLQSGGIVSGSGDGDKVRRVVPEGTFIMNREATAAFGLRGGGQVPVVLEPGEREFRPHEVRAHGRGQLEAMNAAVPRFAKGGTVGGVQLSGTAWSGRELGQNALNLVMKAADAYLSSQRPKGGVGGVAGGAFHKGRFTFPLPAGTWGPPMSIDQGVDIAAPGGTPLLAIAPGTVLGHGITGFGDWAPILGIGHGTKVYYGHAGPGHEVAVGKHVQAGQQVGEVGSGIVGKSSGPHLEIGWYPPGGEGAGASMAAALGLKGLAKGGIVGAGGHASGTEHMLGGFVEALKEGGFTGSGYTVKGIAASGQQMHTAAEIQEAADKTGANHLARVASMMAATQESNMGSTGNTFQLTGDFEGVSPSDRAYIQAIQWFTKGYYDGPVLGAGGGIEKSHKSHDPGLIAQEVEGSAFPHNYDPWKQEGQKWTDGWSGSGGGSGTASTHEEKVPATYHGVRTGSINFPSTPNNLHGVEKELRKWRGELSSYRAAVKAAAKAGKPQIEHALKANVTAIESHLRQLDRERAKLRREIAKKRVTRRLARATGKVGDVETLIEARKKAYEKRSQFAEQIVGLEPTQAILPASATEAEREAAEKDYVARLTGYIEKRESPAYGHVLESEADWRNAILAGESLAAGQAPNGPIGGMEGAFEGRLAKLRQSIGWITNLAGTHSGKWWGQHPKALQHLHEAMAKLPMLRFKEQEVSKALSTTRDAFYPGGAVITDPKPPLPGSGTFEGDLAEVQGIHWPDQHERLAALPPTRKAGVFGGAIWDTQAAIEGLGLRISEAAASLSVPGAGAGEAAGNTAWTAAQEAISLEAQRNLLLSQGETRTFGDFFRELGMSMPYLGAFQMGSQGLRVGRDGLALLHRDEQIVPDAKGPAGSQLAGGSTSAAPQVTVYVDGDIGPLLGKVRAEVDGKIAQADVKWGAGARRRQFAPGRG